MLMDFDIDPYVHSGKIDDFRFSFFSTGLKPVGSAPTVSSVSPDEKSSLTVRSTDSANVSGAFSASVVYSGFRSRAIHEPLPCHFRLGDSMVFSKPELFFLSASHCS